MLYSQNSYRIKNFQVDYTGRLYFFRNDVNSFSPTQLSSKFSYSLMLSHYKIFIDHFCENTIEYKPYDIKRFDILGIKYKNIGTGWTFNKRYVDYEFWLIYEFYYFLFKGNIYFGISENFKKFYPFISIYLLNIIGFETFYNVNSADTLNSNEIPFENPLKLLSFGASLGLNLISAKFEINKFLPINDYIYNFNYKYEVNFILKEKLSVITYLETNSITQLIYPKWLILGLRTLYKGIGIGLNEMYTTNIRKDDIVFRRRAYFFNYYNKFKFFEIDMRYNFIKIDSISNLYVKLGLDIQKSLFFTSMKYEVFSNSFDGYFGIDYGNFRIYYLKKFRNRNSFDYFDNTNDLFGVIIYF